MNISELHLALRDLPGQSAFYTEILGLPLIEATPSRLAVQAGTTRLVFEADSGAGGVYHFAFNIPENKLGGARRWLAERTPLLTREGEDEFDSDLWNAHMVYFRDADGNILEFIARHDLESGTAGPFGPHGVLGVSEIGFPVQDVPEGVEWLRQALALETYREASDTFTPLGDEQGLFIVVPVGRPWFPTHDRASALPLKVVIAGGWEGTLTVPGLPYLICGEGGHEAGRENASSDVRAGQQN